MLHVRETMHVLRRSAGDCCFSFGFAEKQPPNACSRRPRKTKLSYYHTANLRSPVALRTSPPPTALFPHMHRLAMWTAAAIAQRGLPTRYQFAQ